MIPVITPVGLAAYNQLKVSAPSDPYLGDYVHQTFGLVKCVYDFTKNGGAIGALNLPDDHGNQLILPAGTILVRSFLDVITAPTSGGSATVALSSGEGAADVLAATAIASVTGFLTGIQDGTTTHMIKLTAPRQVQMTIATAALTAGKFNLFLSFVYGN